MFRSPIYTIMKLNAQKRRANKIMQTSFGLIPDDIAKNLIAHFMEYTPDFLVPDNRDAYTICVTHAIITARIIQDYDFSKAQWTDVLEILKELDSRAQENIKYTTRNTEFLKEVISKQEKEIRKLSAYKLSIEDNRCNCEFDYLSYNEETGSCNSCGKPPIR